MSLQKLMSDYAEYNLWANNILVEWLKTKPAELLGKEVPSSFPGIIKTFVHIWDTERFWLSVLQAAPPPQSYRIRGFEGTNEEAFEGIVKHSKDFSNYVHSLTEPDLREQCILDRPWAKGQLPKYEFIQHCFNHSTYHRGQIITIGHHVGFTDAPMTDYCFYTLTIRKK